jgi:hypothetical protein
LGVPHLDQKAVTAGQIELHQLSQDSGLVFTGRELGINHPGLDLAVLAIELHDSSHSQGIDTAGVVLIGIQKIEQVTHRIGLRDYFLGLGSFGDQLLTDTMTLDNLWVLVCTWSPAVQ